MSSSLATPTTLTTSVTSSFAVLFSSTGTFPLSATTIIADASSSVTPVGATSSSDAAAASSSYVASIASSVSSVVFASSTPAPSSTATPASLNPSSNTVISPSLTSPNSATASGITTTSVDAASSTSNVVVVTATGTPEANTTIVFTSIVTATQSAGGSSRAPITVTVTSVQQNPTSSTTTGTTTTTSSPATSSSSGSTSIGSTTQASRGSGGLSPAGQIAVAVVVPVVVVALLVLLGLCFWRKRKSRKHAEDARRKEVEEYGYNPNNDPTLPAVGGLGSDSPEMAEDNSGYRGWGNTTTAASTARKTSTTISGLSGGANGMLEDRGQRSPGSFGQGTASDRSGDPLMDGTIGTGVGGVAAAGAVDLYHTRTNASTNGVQRGSSNASSSYSAAGRTDESGDVHVYGTSPQDYSYDHNYSQYPPYTIGASGYGDSVQPVVREVSARRNTRIENPSVWPQPGNSGISQNF